MLDRNAGCMIQGSRHHLVAPIDHASVSKGQRGGFPGGDQDAARIELYRLLRVVLGHRPRDLSQIPSAGMYDVRLSSIASRISRATGRRRAEVGLVDVELDMRWPRGRAHRGVLAELIAINGVIAWVRRQFGFVLPTLSWAHALTRTSNSSAPRSGGHLPRLKFRPGSVYDYRSHHCAFIRIC